ncbi:MAG: ATP-binding protein [Pseudomonadota bacterium]
MPFRCAFTIRSDTRYLALLRQWVSVAVSVAGLRALPPKAVTACTLALIEAVDNAIFHAHRRRRRLPIRVSLALSLSGMTIEVVDTGCGIGRHVVSEPEEPVSHGRGLFLIHRLMTRVESRMKNGRHSLRMVYEL